MFKEEKRNKSKMVPLPLGVLLQKKVVDLLTALHPLLIWWKQSSLEQGHITPCLPASLLTVVSWQRHLMACGDGLQLNSWDRPAWSVPETSSTRPTVGAGGRAAGVPIACWVWFLCWHSFLTQHLMSQCEPVSVGCMAVVSLKTRQEWWGFCKPKR